MKELFGFKVEVPVEYKNGEAIVESYTLYSEAENPEKTWVELHMGIKGAADRKSTRLNSSHRG